MLSKFLPYEILTHIIYFYLNVAYSFNSNVLYNYLTLHGFSKMYKLDYISSRVSKFLMLHINHIRLKSLTGMERRSVDFLSEKYGFKTEKIMAGPVIDCSRCGGSGKFFSRNSCSCCSKPRTCIDCHGRCTNRNAVVTDMILIK
jgi:hypothetical protein